MGAAISRVRSIGGEIDTIGRLNVTVTAGSAATVMQASAQLTKDFAGQQGHFGSCPS